VSWPLFQVDAFTAEPFAGNPAAVCLLEDGAADPGWMQLVAAEMNLSETAFLAPGDGPGAYGLRWFTPTVEVELCGHATLASAHVLWTEGRVPAGQPIRFDTGSGPLAAHPGTGGTIWLDFPATPASPSTRRPG
jgi:PhzF family phenazine biosynthesis protein